MSIRPPSPIAGRLGIATVGLVVVAAAGLLAAYLERGPIGVRLATDYLRRRGVEARLRVDRLEPGGFVGAVSLGPRDRPDFSADRIEVRFGPIPPFTQGFAAPPVTSVRLLRPRLRVRLRNGRLGFGSLQRIVDEALARPGHGPGMDARVEGGLVQIDGDLGPLFMEGDGAMRHGGLDWARLRLRPVDLAGAGLHLRGLGTRALSARGVGGELDVKALGPRRATLRFAGSAGEVRAAGATASAVTLTGSADLTHAGGGPARLDGPLQLDVKLAAASFAGPVRGGAGLRTGASVGLLAFSGRARGAADRLDVHGRAKVDVRVQRAAWPGVGADSAGFGLIADDAALHRSGPAGAGSGWAASGRVRATAEAERAFFGFGAGRRLELARVDGRATGRAAWTGGPSLAMDAALSATGGLSAGDAEALAAVVPASAPRLRAAIARALQGLRLDAPAFALTLAGRRLGLRLDRPVRLMAASGAALALSPRRSVALAGLGPDGASGGFDVTLAGPDLPSATAAVSRYRVAAGAGGVAFDARLGLAVAGDLPPVQGASMRIEATVAGDADRLRVESLGCAPVQVAALGAPRPPVATAAPRPPVTGLAFQLCPGGGPLLALERGRWRALAGVRALRLAAPEAGLAIDQGEARLDLSGDAGGPPRGGMTLARLRATDVAPVVRFRPVTAAGTLTLAGDRVQGALQAALDARPDVRATVRLVHDLRRSEGAATLDAPALAFAPGRLQPADVLPALDRSFTRVKGPAAVSAAARWSAAGLTSDARIRLDGLDVKTVLGPFAGVRGELVLTSLTPLVSAPGQRLTARRLDTLLPLTDVSGVFALRPQEMDIAQATATLARGRVDLGAMRVPFDPRATLRGTARLHAVDFAEVDSALNLSNAVSIQSRVDGVIPFAFGPAGLRVSGGRLFAVGPGRLSIRREALTGAPKAGGAAAGAKTNAVQDFAYQALENLAFESLSADVDSQPKGRLGVLFHVRGRHDPPVAAPTRVGLLDLLRGRAFDKPIPLPKGTPVDLTLAASLNLDELLAGYRGLDSRAGSAEVQR